MKQPVRTIYLPAIDKTVSMGAYVAAIKMAKANPKAEFKHGLTCWWPCTGKEIMHQFRSGMTDRINAAVPYIVRGTGKPFTKQGSYLHA